MIKASRNGNRNGDTPQPTGQKTVRCAIYTRKSTEEGLQQDFNSLDAQREACEAYIASQRLDGWTALAEHYDDGGYTGANTDRPALQRLLADVEAGRLDCVVLYKIDRISRSLLDFAQLMNLFEKCQVSLVSVTQQFSTANSMGRLTLNILMSFAAFERDMISERTRDKLSAARKKGKWMGGTPVLGYTVQPPPGRKLVPIPEEAAMVREIFRLYLEQRSLLTVSRIVNERGWRTKGWTTKEGKQRKQRPFNKNDISCILGNVTYIGQVDFKGEIFPGEHEPIIEEVTFQQVDALLHANGLDNGATNKNIHEALLRGILTCGHCGKAMTHSAVRQPTRLYRYYVCITAQKEGYDKCPTKSVPAQEMERFIVEKLRGMGTNPDLGRVALEEVEAVARERLGLIESERGMIRQQLRALNEEARGLVQVLSAGNASTSVAARLSEVEEQIRQLERRSLTLETEREALAAARVEPDDFLYALRLFDPVWNMLTTQEQARIVQLVLEKVSYNGQTGDLELRFSPAGIKALAGEYTQES